MASDPSEPRPRAPGAAAEPPAPSSVHVHKFPCPRCGADVVWNPGSAKVRCQYCGYERDASDVVGAAPEIVHERPLEEGLKAPAKVGWGTERRTFKCTKCGAVSSLEKGAAASACPFCGTPAVVETPADAKLVRPEGVLPFRISRHDALAKFRTWLASLWFRPNDLRQKAEVESIRGVYVPFWTFDAQTSSRWQAEAGYRRGSGNNSRIEWRPVSGTLDHFFDDVPVPASRGLDGDTSRHLEPFPTDQLVAYDPDYLSGFQAEEYGTPLDQAFAMAKARMEATLRAACRGEVPGDACRNLVVQTRWSGLAYKSGLVPVWIAAYEYTGKSFRYAVNGATGKATGTAPWSPIKIALALATVATILMFFYWLTH
jgi:DNA-directed RNA polymerase subunit RPC12/RpoP